MAIAAANTGQMNIRINAELKSAGDALFAQWGLTPSEAVRRLYETVVRTGEQPFADTKEATVPAGYPASHAVCGLALNLYEELAGINTVSEEEARPSYKELRDLMYDEMFEEYLRMRDGGDA